MIKSLAIILVYVLLWSAQTETFNVKKTSFGEKVDEALCQSFCKEKEKTSESCFIEDCHCTSKETSERRVTLFPNAVTLKTPVLQCVQYDTVATVWKNEDDLFYFAEIFDRLNRTRYSQVTNCKSLLIEDLAEGTDYKIRIWGFSVRRNFSAHSDFLTVTTSFVRDVPKPVREVSLVGLTLKNGAYEAEIAFRPGQDNACAFDVVWFGETALGDYKQEELTDPTHLHEVTLSKLELSTNYSVSIAAKHIDGQEESEKTWFWFLTPSCLEAYKSLDKCPPEAPENFTATETIIQHTPLLYNVEISWSEPKLKPSYYEANFMNLIPADHNSSGLLLNISGNVTSAVFEKIDLGVYYQVILTAISPGGSSRPALHHRHLTRVKSPTIQESRTPQIIFIVAGPIIAILFVVIIMVGFNFYKTKRDRIEQRCHYFTQLEEKSIFNSDTQSAIQDVLTLSNFDEWEIDPDKLHHQMVFGEGAFGIVRKGLLENKNGIKSEVAIKMLKQSPSADEVRQFNHEIEIMKSVKRHPYVVSLIGCITREHIDGPLLVVEFCSRGDLQSYLRNAWDRLTNAHNEVVYRDQSVSSTGQYFANQTYELHGIDPYLEFVIQPKHLLSIARQVALGMEHLAKTRVVHRDLAARNVLVCEDFTVKVSDFGLSRDVYQDNVYFKNTGGKLPVRWMALESLTHQRYTTQSDVWSFGVLLWEIVTLGATPYAGFSSKDLLPLIRRGYRLEKPAHCGEELYRIMHTCWEAAPKDRPNFTELSRSLETLLEGVSDYINLENIEQPTYEDDSFNQKAKVPSNSSESYIRPIVL